MYEDSDEDPKKPNGQGDAKLDAGAAVVVAPAAAVGLVVEPSSKLVDNKVAVPAPAAAAAAVVVVAPSAAVEPAPKTAAAAPVDNKVAVVSPSVVRASSDLKTDEK